MSSRKYRKEFGIKNPLGASLLVSGAMHLGERIMGEVAKGYKKGKSKWAKERKKNAYSYNDIAKSLRGKSRAQIEQIRNVYADKLYSEDFRERDIARKSLEEIDKVLAKKKNPGNSAESMAEAFHGREATEEFDVEEIESYDSDMAVLGSLIELGVVDGKTGICINFEDDLPKLCCDGEGKNLEIIGGDQRLELDDDAPYRMHGGKKLVPIGFIKTIAYRSDKHHLEGSNGKEEDYQHEFGEEGGALPMLVYNVGDEKLLVVGGGYTIEDVGIKD